MEDTIKIRGDVVLTMTYFDGRKERHELKNLVVNNGKTILSRLLGHHASYTGEYVSQIAFGTSSTAAAVTDTALGAQVLAKPATVTYPAFNQVTFSATMLASEGGTNTYQEIGLLSAGTNILFSRLIIGAIVKSALYQIQVDWTISFQ